MPQDTADTAAAQVLFTRSRQRFILLLFAALLATDQPAWSQVAEGSTLEKHLLPLSGPWEQDGRGADPVEHNPFGGTQASKGLGKAIDADPATAAAPQDSVTVLQRHVRVWLPPGYPEQAPYPVLLMLDGQNLFDALTAFAGEWGLDEVLVQRQQAGLPVPVVIGVDNGGTDRIYEYSPYPNAEYRSGGAPEHLAFLKETVLPWAHDRYALSRERAKTGLGGSSLGGLMTLWAGLQDNQPFGFLLAFSPSIWFNQELLNDALTTAPENRWYLRMGSQEASADSLQVMAVDAQLLDRNAGNLLEFGNRLRRAGCGPARARIHIDAKGQHNEATWRRWLPDAMAWWLDTTPSAP